MNRAQVFQNLETKYEQWLKGLKQSGFAAASHYVANLKAIGEPIAPHSANTAKWCGLFELLTGKKPNKGVFEVNGVAEFSAIYGSAVSFFTAEKSEKEQIRLFYPQCTCFDDLFDFAYQNGNVNLLGDGGHTRNGFVKYCQFLCELESQVTVVGPVALSTVTLGPIQKIVYGAPGTGKSFGTDDKLTDEYGNAKAVVFRTTFHPDSDYSTFVGAYKPTMKRVPRIVQIGQDIKTPNYAAGFDESLKVEEKIAYEFRPQAFMNAYVAAWKEMAKGANGKPVVLVIEEINRGNCAQIFGDLFQLLDRDDATGYSTYPITADTDLAKWLASEEKDAAGNLLRFGTGIADPGKPACIKSDDWAKVLKGEMLVLPPNLYIWATMNTSDQSLFPIDSAFKRRWDWKYVPIREGKYKDGPKAGQKMGWKIKFTVPAHQDGGQGITAKDYSYDWWEFLKNINAKIFKTTESEDKKLGYFFVKPDGEDAQTHDGTISADRFVSKVIFYLWNDVFKDYGIETIFKADDAKKSEDAAKGVEFQSFFNEEDDKADVNTLLKFFKHIGLKSDEENAAAQPAQPQAPTSSQDA